MKTTVYDTAKRDWGFETQTVVVDDNGDVWGEMVFFFFYPKTKSEVDKIIATAENRVTKRLAIKEAETEPEVTYKKSEIEILLKEKELLGADESLDDLKNKDQLTAEKEAVK